VRTYDWDGPDGKGIPDPENVKDNKENVESEYMQKYRPKTPPMLYATMYNRR
jgi:hypothetical protein